MFEVDYLNIKAKDCYKQIHVCFQSQLCSSFFLCARTFLYTRCDRATCAGCHVRLRTLWGDYKRAFRRKHEYFQSEYVEQRGRRESAEG